MFVALNSTSIKIVKYFVFVNFVYLILLLYLNEYYNVTVVNMAVFKKKLYFEKKN